MVKLGCELCRREPEPGFIESDNNGPIWACRGCNADWDSPSAIRQREFDAALAQRSGRAALADGGRHE